MHVALRREMRLSQSLRAPILKPWQSRLGCVQCIYWPASLCAAPLGGTPPCCSVGLLAVRCPYVSRMFPRNAGCAFFRSCMLLLPRRCNGARAPPRLSSHCTIRSRQAADTKVRQAQLALFSASAGLHYSLHCSFRRCRIQSEFMHRRTVGYRPHVWE